MSQPVMYLAASLLLMTLLATLAFLSYATLRYAPIIARVFEEKPLFFPLRLAPEPGGEDVQFKTSDGLDLTGTYYRATTRARTGVLVFCHEYLSDRWSYRPYADAFRGLGFDIFTFDFRNHGGSASDPSYQPLQWVSEHEVTDLSAALAYLRSRPDRDPAGYGLFGVSRGGGTALVAGSRDPSVWGVITDGAFPTRGTMLTYILRWAQIYVANDFLWKAMPLWVFRLVGWAGRLYSSYRLKCWFPDVETAVSRLSPRPWLMIHGERDAYIVPAIARALFDAAKEPKEAWFVPKAKHNRCQEVEPALYAERVTAFLSRFAALREAAVPAAVERVPIDPGPTAARLKADLASSSVLSGRMAAPASG